MMIFVMYAMFQNVIRSAQVVVSHVVPRCVTRSVPAVIHLWCPVSHPIQTTRARVRHRNSSHYRYCSLIVLLCYGYM